MAATITCMDGERCICIHVDAETFGCVVLQSDAKFCSAMEICEDTGEFHLIVLIEFVCARTQEIDRENDVGTNVSGDVEEFGDCRSHRGLGVGIEERKVACFEELISCW